MKTLINLTPHVLCLYAPKQDDLDTPPRLLAMVPSSGVARVASTPGAIEETHIRFNSGDSTHDLYHFPIAQPFQWGAIEGLPEPQDGVIYVVSLLVAQRAMRADVVSPGTGPNDNCIRDDQGRIAGVTRLIAWA